MIEVFLASTDSITEFRLQPADYDARTVEEALMENQQAFEAIRSHIDELLMTPVIGSE